MTIEYLGWPFFVAMLIVYGFCCIMGMLFSFFPERYRRIEERTEFSFSPFPVIALWDINVSSIDCWAKQHNKGIGVVLSIFSVFNLVAFTRILIA